MHTVVLPPAKFREGGLVLGAAPPKFLPAAAFTGETVGRNMLKVRPDQERDVCSG